MVFLVGERNRGRNNYTVACVYADRVKVFHAAHCDYVARAVAHNLEFYLLPAVDVLLDKNLGNRREVKTASRNRKKFVLVIRNAAARTAEGECRADDNRETNFLGDFQRGVYIRCDVGRDNRLTEREHGFFKQLSVLRSVDCVLARSDEGYAHFFEKAFL